MIKCHFSTRIDNNHDHHHYHDHYHKHDHYRDHDPELESVMSGKFYSLAMFQFSFVQNIGNLPKFNFQTGNLAKAAQYNLDQVKVAHICQRRRERDLQPGSLQWQ